MNWDDVLNEVEDYLFPKMELSHRERSLYYHVLLHSRFAGKDSGLFSLPPLSTALGIAERSIREGLRILQDKGCIQIEEISRRGHLIRAFLPSEIKGLLPSSGSSPNGPQEITETTEVAEVAEPIELETIPEAPPLTFAQEPKQETKPRPQSPMPPPLNQGDVSSQLVKESGHCFFCLRKLPKGTFKASKSGAGEGASSFQKSPVATCSDCESQKQGTTDENFLRQLYRKGFLSAGELEERLQALAIVQAT